MIDNKRYELTINQRGQLDIIDHIESKKQDAICIYNDLGVPPFSSAKAICDLLNEKEETIQELKKRIEQDRKNKMALLSYVEDVLNCAKDSNFYDNEEIVKVISYIVKDLKLHLI